MIKVMVNLVWVQVSTEDVYAQNISKRKLTIFSDAVVQVDH